MMSKFKIKILLVYSMTQLLLNKCYFNACKYIILSMYIQFTSLVLTNHVSDMYRVHSRTFVIESYNLVLTRSVSGIYRVKT